MGLVCGRDPQGPHQASRSCCGKAGNFQMPSLIPALFLSSVISLSRNCGNQRSGSACCNLICRKVQCLILIRRMSQYQHPGPRGSAADTQHELLSVLHWDGKVFLLSSWHHVLLRWILNKPARPSPGWLSRNRQHSGWRRR